MADEQGPGRGWLAAVLGSSAIGLGISLYLTNLHLDLFYGAGVGEALCDLGEGFSCSSVNSAPESEIFGIPQSVLALPTYVLAGALGYLARSRQDRRFAAALGGMALLCVLYSAYLAWVSATLNKAWCLFCIALYIVNGVLLILGVAGSKNFLTTSTNLPFEAPRLVGGSVVAWGLLLAGALQGYHMSKDSRVEVAKAAVLAPPPAPVATAAPATQAPATAGGADGETKKLRLPAARANVKLPAGLPFLGKNKAPVQVVEFSDFQCPFCKRLATSLHQLAAEYPQDVQVSYVYFPLNLDCNAGDLPRSMHPEACNAAVAAHCADQQGKFWEMHDQLFDRQGELGAKTYLRMANEIGLDEARFQSCVADPASVAAVRKATELGKELGVTGTPTFFVNGRQMAGAQPIEILRAVVEAEKAGNKELLDLEVKVNTETTGPVTGAPQVAVAAIPGLKIDSFEASFRGNAAASLAGVAPARGVSWYDARNACELAGKRLCTEQEWLSACTGELAVDQDKDGIASNDEIRGRRYGYGDQRKAGACADSRNPDAVGELLTGNHPLCSTPDGIYDLTGGVKEWVGLTPATAGLKGGSYSSGESARCGYYRDDIAADVKDQATGFRCCEGPPTPAAAAVVPGRDVGEKLETFELPKVGGGDFSSRSLAGKPAVISFWATWCGPCQKEMPLLASMYEKYKAQGLQVLGINVDKEDAKVATWLGAHPMPFTLVRDPNGVMMATFPNRGLPTTLWVRKDGTIRLRTTGIPPGGDRRIEELVNELLSL
ncbi:MAG TPA: thioredoxin domain-containing protein [Myxococcota bacterium]|nr:thioredoxin domain-containing protein [Myxococcota bacterium]